MQSREFYISLAGIGGYSWNLQDNVLKGVKSSGQNKGLEVNPVTALATSQGKGSFGTGKRDTLKAGKALGLSTEFINHVFNAANGATNRGNTQVVRGKIRSALEI